MGTRFMCTMEAPIHVKIKESIVAAQETDTQLVLRKWKNTSRLFKNKVSSEAYRIENDPETKEFKAVGPLVSGARGRQVFVNGDPDFGVCFFFFLSLLFCSNLKLKLIKKNRSGQLVKSSVSFTISLHAKLSSLESNPKPLPVYNKLRP